MSNDELLTVDEATWQDVERLRGCIGDKDYASITCRGNGDLEIALRFHAWEGCSGWALASRALRLLWVVFRARRGEWVADQ